MKILHIIDSEGLYGAEAMLLNLASEQIKQGVQVTILNMRRCNPNKVSLQSEAARLGVHFCTFQIKTGPDIVGAMKIICYAKTAGIDIIHSHGYKPNILIGFIPPRIRKMPLVITLHGWTSTVQVDKLRLYEWLDLKSLKHADVVVSVSKATGHHRALRELRTETIHNGISKIEFKPKAELANQSLVKFCENNFTIGSIGRLSPEKGYGYLIDAFSVFARREGKVKLVILGDGKEKSDLQRKIDKSELGKRILLAGYQSNAALYIPLLKIFVLSSLTEGLPITVLEAMQANVPVICSKVGGLEEMLVDKETGILVEKENVTEMSRAMETLYLSEELRSKISANAKKLSTSQFSSETMAAKYKKLYDRILYKK
jgi:glycosyltransferase involved in cell wall biosynthesis